MLIGHLKTIPITSVLQLLCDEHKTGVLRAQFENEQVKFFLKDGSILCVMGTLKQARLGNLLQNSNLISPDELEKVLQLSKEKNQALGKILIDNGYITHEKLTAVINKQAEEIIANLLSWDGGDFEYRDGNINTKDMIIAPINLMGLILEATRRKDEIKSQSRLTCNFGNDTKEVRLRFIEGEIDCD